VFEKILVPMDLSEKQQQVIEVAINLAGHEHGEVTLLHIIEVIAGLSFEEEHAFYSRLETAARDHLNQYGDVLSKHKVGWGMEVRYGSRAEEIVRYAEEVASDLIILRSHRIDPGAPGAGWGTLSYKVGILSSRPVLLVK
jgi:nucleotide-binding universal stress UspA family protein